MDKKLEEVKKTIAHLEKLGWEYEGFDYGDLGDVFIKRRDVFRYLILISCDSISFDCIRTDTNQFPFEQVPFRFLGELPLFYKLYDYISKERRSLPRELAKNQKTYDDWAKWENGETVCTFENGVLSCGVESEEEE